MRALVRCSGKTFLYSWLCYKGRACRMTTSLLRDRLDWTMGTLDLRPHTYSFAWFPDDLWVLSNHFSWNTSLFSPQILSQLFPRHCTQWTQVFKVSIQQKWDTFSSSCQEPDFCQLYTVYKKPLLSAFPVLWGMHMNNFKLGKCCWEFCFIGEF